MKSIVAASAIALASTSPAHASLTGAAQLAAVYDAILDARFEQVDAQLKQGCPPAPEGACQVLRVVALWWQISLNPESRALDHQLRNGVFYLQPRNEAWTSREPKRAEAWLLATNSTVPAPR